MNIVGRLFGFGASLQGSNTPELVKIPSGQLFLVRPGNIRSSRECIYNDAMATVRKAPSVEHNFQLVITRVFEEGEEDILEEEDENDDKVFLIGTELEFRTGEVEGEPTLIWRDLDGDVDETYEFVASDANTHTVELFCQYLYRAMYERKYKTSSDDASPKDLQEFIWKPPKKRVWAQKGKRPSKDKSDTSTDALVKDLNKLTVSEEGSGSTELISSEAEPPDTTTARAMPVPAIITKKAELYLWDQEDGHFLKQDDINASITRPIESKFDFFITATTLDGQQLLSHRLTSDLNSRWSNKLTSFTWNHVSTKGILSSWCFKFENFEDYKEFQEAHGGCLYETLNQARAKADEQQYMISSYSTDDDVEMYDAEEDDEEDASEVENALGLGGEQSEDSEEEEESESETEDEGREELLNASKDKNSQLTVGYKNDRTFVVRGDKIGVFKRTGTGKVEYAATIKDLGFKKMKSFKPKHMMLHENDAKMILMNPLEKHSLFSMDIEHGKIVEEWKVDENINIDYIAPKSKLAPMTGEQTLVGTSSNALFRIDPRQGHRGGNALADIKQYASKNAFSGLTTTGEGKIAVVSEKGDIRLFDSIGKIAKTSLPAMGDPILGIDVTQNGRWIVATCKTYLLVLDTLIGNGRYAGSLGFDRSFPADSKPQPKRLQLRTEHAAYMGHDVSFTPAYFNKGEHVDENAIVTSSGRYVIAWDFAKVKKNKLDSYVIKKYEDEVVQDNFRFGDDKEIIVALTDDVLAIKKKNLGKLPSATLTTPARNRASTSGIVNCPY